MSKPDGGSAFPLNVRDMKKFVSVAPGQAYAVADAMLAERDK